MSDEEIEAEEISAAYRNGVLQVTLPAPVGATTKGIEIDVEG